MARLKRDRNGQAELTNSTDHFARRLVRNWHEGEAEGGQSQFGFAPVVQTSTCSAMVRASSTSMPRYLTVLSIFVCPTRGLHTTHPWRRRDKARTKPIEDLAPYLLGWRGYFGFCQTPRVLTR